MVASAVQLAKRAFLKVLLAFAAQYVVLVNVNRDSPDKDVMAAFRRVAKKAHPDKGGRVQDAQELHAAKDAWEERRHREQRPTVPSACGRCARLLTRREVLPVASE